MALLFTAVSLLQAFEIKEIDTSGGKRRLKWDTSRGPIRITLNQQGSADLPIETVETALRNAMSQWQNVSGQAVRFEYAGRNAAAVANDVDSINSVVWLESNWPYSPSVAAITRFSFFVSDPPFFADADILLNGQTFRWSLTPGGGTVHPQQVLIHELGHLLGLAHSSNFSSTMFPSLLPNQNLTLFKDDIEGLRFLYGIPAGDFRQITPLAGAVYNAQAGDGTFPLPVYRWARGPFSNFSIEFSDTPTFQKKFSIPAGANDFFVPNGTQQKRILSLSPAKSIQWRVVSGMTRTPARVIRFRKSTAPSQVPVQGDARTAEESLNHVWKEVAILAALFITLCAAALAFFLSQHRHKAT
jgi:hypothetical protein